MKKWIIGYLIIILIVTILIMATDRGKRHFVTNNEIEQYRTEITNKNKNLSTEEIDKEVQKYVEKASVVKITFKEALIKSLKICTIVFSIVTIMAFFRKILFREIFY